MPDVEAAAAVAVTVACMHAIQAASFSALKFTTSLPPVYHQFTHLVHRSSIALVKAGGQFEVGQAPLGADHGKRPGGKPQAGELKWAAVKCFIHPVPA